MLSFNVGDCFSEGYSEMSLIVLILGPLTFIFILIYLRACFVLSSSQVHFFLFFWSSGKLSIFSANSKRQTLPIRDSRPNCGDGNGERSSVSMFYVLWTTFLSIWCWMSPLSLTPALTSWPMQSKQGEKTKQSAGIGEIFFCSPTMGIEQFEGTLKKRQKDWDVLYYMLTKHTRTNMYTVIHKFKC